MECLLPSKTAQQSSNKSAFVSGKTLLLLLYIIQKYFFFTLDKHYNPHPLCLVVYYILPGFMPTVVSHGNCKSGSPFYPTLPSTKVLIKDELLHSGLKCTVASVSVELPVRHIQENYQEMSNRYQISSLEGSRLHQVKSGTDGGELYTVCFVHR